MLRIKDQVIQVALKDECYAKQFFSPQGYFFRIIATFAIFFLD